MWHARSKQHPIIHFDKALCLPLCVQFLELILVPQLVYACNSGGRKLKAIYGHWLEKCYLSEALYGIFFFQWNRRVYISEWCLHACKVLFLESMCDASQIHLRQLTSNQLQICNKLIGAIIQPWLKINLHACAPIYTIKLQTKAWRLTAQDCMCSFLTYRQKASLLHFWSSHQLPIALPSGCSI